MSDEKSVRDSGEASPKVCKHCGCKTYGASMQCCSKAVEDRRACACDCGRRATTELGGRDICTEAQIVGACVNYISAGLGNIVNGRRPAVDWSSYVSYVSGECDALLAGAWRQHIDDPAEAARGAGSAQRSFLPTLDEQTHSQEDGNERAAARNAPAAREYHFTREVDVDGSAAQRAPLGVRCPRCREVKGIDCCQESPCPCSCHFIERAQKVYENGVRDVRREAIEACAALVETLPSMGLREVAARLRASQFTRPTEEKKT